MVTHGRNSSVYLFVGSEVELKKNALLGLKNSFLGGSAGELDYKVFYGGETAARDILNYASTFPFLSSKRIIVIKDVEKLPRDEIRRLAEYVNHPPKSTCLIMESKDDSVVDSFGSAAERIEIKYFNELKDEELSLWIKRFLAPHNKSIAPEAYDLLKELKGKCTLSLRQELDKLISFVGERPTITAKDAEETVGRSLVASAFDITWAVGEQNMTKALKIAHEILSSGKRPHEIMGILSWHLGRMLRAKVLKTKGLASSRIAAMLRIRRIDDEPFFRQLDLFSLAQIASKIRVLAESDLDIKRSRFDQNIILEQVIIRLCLG